MNSKKIERAHIFLSSYEDLISKTSYPTYYYEWAILDKLRINDDSYISTVYQEAHKFPNVYQTLLAIKESFHQPFEKVYPSAIQTLINELSVLAHRIVIHKDELACKQLILKADEGHCDEFTIQYYKLCIQAFKKLSTVCHSYPFGSPIIFETANLAADLKARADMASTTKLQKLLDMDIEYIMPNGRKILELSNMPESKTLEFKSSFNYDIRENCQQKALKKECTKTIAAFLNAEGGILLVGVADDGEILGLKKDLYYAMGNADEFVLNFKETVKNSIGGGFFNNVSWHLEKVGGDKKVLLVEVKVASSPCWHYKDDFYVRNNASSDKLSAQYNNIDNYIYHRFQK